jgi:hypothetical protein
LAEPKGGFRRKSTERLQFRDQRLPTCDTLAPMQETIWLRTLRNATRLGIARFSMLFQGLLVALASLFATGLYAQSTTYTYQGNPYNSFDFNVLYGAGPQPVSPQNPFPTNSISGSLTTTAPIPPSTQLWWSPTSSVCHQGPQMLDCSSPISVQSISFSDGIRTWNSLSGLDLFVSTNARTLSGVTRRASVGERRNADRRVTSDRDV